MAKSIRENVDPPHALPPPAAERTPKDPPKKDSPEKPPSWLLRGGAALGGFLAGIAAGVAAGYAFCKAEGKFTSMGEGILGQFLKGWVGQSRGGYAGARKPAWREGPPDFSHRDTRRPHDRGDDPMGEGSGSDLQQEDDSL